MFVFPRVREPFPTSIDGWVLPEKEEEDGYAHTMCNEVGASSSKTRDQGVYFLSLSS